MERITLTDAEIEKLYSQGNNTGRGYALGEHDMDPIEVSVSERLADSRTWDSHNTQGVNVIGRDRSTGHLIAIADIYGPWAVDMTNEMAIASLKRE